MKEQKRRMGTAIAAPRWIAGGGAGGRDGGYGGLGGAGGE
jgi:hypothetical protein